MARSIEDIRLENSFAALPRGFHARVTPRALPEPRLLAFCPRVAGMLGWDAGLAGDAAFLSWVSGHRQLPGSEPIATVYAGHQFGVWVPQLGDGRAMLLGEVRGPDGELLDVQLKGAGITPYSRQGDGRAVWRSVIREYLAGIAMHGLGIPTTHALAIVGSDEPVQRETVERAAVLVRVARSHIRFGHFEYFSHHGDHAALRVLVDYTLARHFPDLLSRDEPLLEMFGEVCTRTADLIARWMAVGFQHGVMNTDNMSITGDTLDYGPYGFMEAFDPSWICNHSDHTGRYAYMQQPGIGLWNLGRLASALLPLSAEAPLVAALEAYQAEVAERHLARMREKIGLAELLAEDADLIATLLGLLHRDQVDYTRFFHGLTDHLDGADAAKLHALFKDREGIEAWSRRYRQRLGKERGPVQACAQRMRTVNPKYVLRNYLAQTAIEHALAGDAGTLHALAQVLEQPFAAWPAHEAWAAASPAWAQHLEISCSS